MFRYEVKKVFAKTGGKIALLLLAGVPVMACWFTVDVSYTNESGEQEYGVAAVRKLKEAQKEWAGTLDEEKLRQVIEELRRIDATPQAQSEDVRENNIAYGRQQGVLGIRRLMVYAYADGFRSSNYYRPDSLNPDDASDFYSNRLTLLKEWKQLFEWYPMVAMLTMIILGYLVSGIFSGEFRWKADAIFFTAKYGRNKAVAAKVKAGFGIVTVIYRVMVLLYTAFVLLYLGADGAACPIQVN